MKLIKELVEEVQLLTEASESGKKNYFIHGPFLVAEQKNKNNRIYPINVMEKEVARYTKDLIKENRAFGELGHPSGPQINLERVSHMITELKKDGNVYYGKAKIMETPYGMTVRNLLDAGAKLGVSSRGLGSLKECKDGIMEVQEDFYLATAADIVADPSAPGAFVNGIMENTDFWFDSATGQWKMQEAIDKTKTYLKTLSLKQIEEQKLKVFDQFLKSII